MSQTTRQQRVRLRPIEEHDLPEKVRWVNDGDVHQFLHYDLPISLKKTREWFQRIQHAPDRKDLVIETMEGTPLGLAGLLSIDFRNRRAELYILLGEKREWGKGYALEALHELLKMAFHELRLNRVYLFTETGNRRAQRLFERCGFAREGILRQDVLRDGAFRDRLVYGVLRQDYEG